MRDDGRDKISKRDIFLFYALPIIISIGVVFLLNKNISSDTINLLITIFSIFVGLLLNLLVLIVGFRNTIMQNAIKHKVLDETFYNISYAILISVILIVLLFTAIVSSGIPMQIISTTSFFIIGNFILTLLMILKRVHMLLTKQDKKPQCSDSNAKYIEQSAISKNK
ncbi:hypothetical protein CKA38_02420 [Ereboglobus luteus]|uniref:Uncharacterized protein n=2 Tax=Ereboglobus luteus TaxID=1796921 RepID=A0A2U8E095_9BACT|nr:hypothetical protein CKA38_02420 [Ereboglobus luteus]